MRVILQKVSRASCKVNNRITGQIDVGYLLLVGFTHSDTNENVQKAAKKIANLRIFEDENMKMNLNLSTVGGSILSISQFTLYADISGGNRPSFTEAMVPCEAIKLYKLFNDELRKYGFTVEEGIFGEYMDIELVNLGPTTIIIEY